MENQSLILIAFMGVGKSSVGRAAAKILKIPHYDTDDWLEQNAGIDIPDLVRNDMARFRELEAQALRTLLGERPGIISTGGGIVAAEVGRQALRQAQVPIVWLDAPFEVVAEHIKHDTGRERPLFNNIDQARRLNDQRIPLYDDNSTHRVDASQPFDSVVAQVVQIAQSRKAS